MGCNCGGGAASANVYVASANNGQTQTFTEADGGAYAAQQFVATNGGGHVQLSASVPSQPVSAART